MTTDDCHEDGGSIQDFIEQVHKANGFRALWAVSLKFFQSHGMIRLSYLHSPPPGAPDYRSGRYFSQGFPKDWIRHYVDDQLSDVDPIPNFALHQTRPFLWSQITQLKKLSPAEQAFMNELTVADLGDGLAIPVFGPAGRNGYVGLGFKEGEGPPSDYCVRQLQWAAQIAHIKYCELVIDKELSLPDLSPREREILQWVARGKSNSSIASIVGISANTVDTHLRRIYSKFHVNDRTTAAIQGIGAGLIQ